MKKDMIKYCLVVVFVFLQAQLFANAVNKSTKIDKSYRTSENEFLMLQKFAPNLYIDFFSYQKMFFYADNEPFSIRAEVDNNGCFTGNSNLIEARFILTNVTTQAVVISNRTTTSGNKIRLTEASGFALEGFTSEGLLPVVSYYNTTVTVQPGASITLRGKFDLSTNNQLTATLKIDLAKFNYTTLGGNVIEGAVTQSLESSVAIYRTPVAPTVLSRALHPQSYYTVGTASGLSNLQNYAFYYNNSLISSQTPLKFDAQNRIAIGIPDGSGNIVYNYVNSLLLQYSEKNNLCEGARSNLTYTLDTTIKPLPGTISQTASQICMGGSVTFQNLTIGSANGTGGTSVAYSWEVSYDDGESWQVPTASSLIEINLTETGNFIRFNNLTQNVKVRRKYKRGTANDLVYAYTTPLSVEVINNEIYLPNNWAIYYVKQGDTFTLPTATSKYQSNIVLTNQSGATVSNQFVAPNTPGEFTFTYTATSIVGNVAQGFSPLACTTTRAIKIVVYDVTTCNIIKKRTYSTIAKPWATGLSGVTNASYAVNNNRAQYATLTGGVVLLGLGAVGIDLYFTKPNGDLYTGAELKGKKVVVKLGEQYSGLKLIGGLSVVGRQSNAGVTAATLTSSNATSVGAVTTVKGGLLDLLKGDNVFEFSFIPAAANGTTVDYNGIRIQLSSLLGVADRANVFYAFVEENETINSTNNPCEDLTNAINVTPPSVANYPTVQKGYAVSNTNFSLNPFVEDIFWGNYTEVLNVASGLAAVTYPYYSVDNNYNSYAIFNTTVGALNQQFIDVKLRRNARPGDKIQIILGTEAVNILNLSLLNLTGYKIKFFYENTEVGSITLNQFKVLDLGLLITNPNQKVIISAPAAAVFDRIQLEQTNTVNVNIGNQLHIYDIRVNPTTLFVGQTDSKVVTNLCAADFLKIQKFDFCTDYEISFAEATFNLSQQLRDEAGQLLTDSHGNPIYSISAVNDISDSNLGTPVKIENNIAYYTIRRLFTNVGNRLLVKIQTKRNGCNYGDPQYLRVNLTNCIDAISNPVIKSGGA